MHRVKGLGRLQRSLRGGWAKEGDPWSKNRGRGMRRLGEGKRREPGIREGLRREPD